MQRRSSQFKTKESLKSFKPTGSWSLSWFRNIPGTDEDILELRNKEINAKIIMLFSFRN